MDFEIWGISGEFKEKVESLLPTVTQHIGSVGTLIPWEERHGDRYEQVAEDIVRLAHFKENNYEFSKQIQLKSYSEETRRRLHNNGFIGVEIIIPAAYNIFLDYRCPVDTVDLLMDDRRIATAELCMAQYGQVIALFSRESIPISTNDSCQWTITLTFSHKGFRFDDVEVYWIFGEPNQMPITHIIDDKPMIHVFLYGNTDWSVRLPFQHRLSDLLCHNNLYTNLLMLDQNGNAVGVRYAH